LTPLVALRRDVPEPGSDNGLPEEFPAPRKAERALAHDLRPVVGKAKGGAGERCSHHRNRARAREVSEDQDWDQDRDEDDHAAHRRRAGFGVVLDRTLVTNVLAELAAAQEADELRSEEDRDQQGRHCADQDLTHQPLTSPGWRLALTRISPTFSSPTEREPFTSTVSPGLATRRTT
jgi:hypothetical protein